MNGGESVKVKVSHHAKQRANQRLNVAYKAERNKLFKRAIKYGHPPTDFAGDFNLWLSAKKKNKNVGIKVYDGNIFIYKNRLVVNLLWPIIFFLFKLKVLAFFWILALILIVGYMMYEFYRENKLSSYLLIPYMLWIIFASILNLLEL